MLLLEHIIAIVVVTLNLCFNHDSVSVLAQVTCTVNFNEQNVGAYVNGNPTDPANYLKNGDTVDENQEVTFRCLGPDGSPPQIAVETYNKDGKAVPYWVIGFGSEKRTCTSNGQLDGDEPYCWSCMKVENSDDSSASYNGLYLNIVEDKSLRCSETDTSRDIPRYQSLINPQHYMYKAVDHIWKGATSEKTDTLCTAGQLKFESADDPPGVGLPDIVTTWTIKDGSGSQVNDIVTTSDQCANFWCPAPAIEEGVMQITAMSNAYPYKTILEFGGCKDGYEMTEEGSSMECQFDRTFTGGPPPVCKLIVCPAPEMPRNARQEFPEPAPVYVPGVKIKYVCDEGYTVACGDLERTCQATKSFSGSPPHCKVLRCPVPELPEFVAQVYPEQTDVAVGSTLQYTCLDGYDHQSGDLSRECRHKSSLAEPLFFTGQPPVCKPSKCAAVPRHSKTLQVMPAPAAFYAVGSTVRYTCADGYERACGDVVQTCNSDMELSGLPLYCKLKRVVPPPAQDKAQMNKTSTDEPSGTAGHHSLSTVTWMIMAAACAAASIAASAGHSITI